MIYLQWRHIYNWAIMGKGRKNKEIIGKNKENLVWLPSCPLSMMWRADCFPVSERTENKTNYPYGGVDLN